MPPGAWPRPPLPPLKKPADKTIGQPMGQNGRQRPYRRSPEQGCPGTALASVLPMNPTRRGRGVLCASGLFPGYGPLRRRGGVSARLFISHLCHRAAGEDKEDDGAAGSVMLIPG